jgi:hypothetical protein
MNGERHVSGTGLAEYRGHRIAVSSVSDIDAGGGKVQLDTNKFVAAAPMAELVEGRRLKRIDRKEADEARGIF